MNKPSIKDAFFNNGAAKKIGGQAIIEGVMMRGVNNCAMAVRKTDQTVEIVEVPMKPDAERLKILKIPIIRGVVSFVESLVTGMKTLMRSAEIAGMDLDDDEPSKFDTFLLEKFGEKKLMTIMVYISVVIAIALSVGLFMALPVTVGHFFTPLITKNGVTNEWARSVIEGFARIFIFLIYIFLISKYKDIQRVFEYHGAEHKTINCYEAGGELTVENAKQYPRLHKRCGTSFLFIVMIISMIVFLFIRTNDFWMRLLSRILLVPVIAGISYEFLKFAGKSRSRFIFALSYPGLCLQMVTTKEPDDMQLETAILAIKKVIEGDIAPGPEAKAADDES